MPLGPKMVPLQGSDRLISNQLFQNMVRIKGNEAYNNMLSTSLPFHIPLTPGWSQKVICVSFLKVVMLHIKIMGMKQRTQWKQIVCPFTHPRPLDVVKTSKSCCFFYKGHVAYQTTSNIMRVKCLTLCYPLSF